MAQHPSLPHSKHLQPPLQELQYLNLALNNITAIEGLSKCESLRKLDLTLNFIPAAALPTVASLAPCYDLRDLTLLGNPCTKWPGYRAYVISQLPQLRCLDGEETGSEREAALLAQADLHQQLVHCIASSPSNADFKASDMFDNCEECSIKDGTAHGAEDVQPWCPATRIRDQRQAPPMPLT